jgi:hypothetical protein
MSNVEFRLGRCMTSFRSFSPPKLILIGAGAINDSWKPLESVFRDAVNISSINFKVFSSNNKNNEMAAYLGQLVYGCHVNSISKLQLRNDKTADDSQKANIEKEIDRLNSGFHSFINAICYNYKEAKLKLRKESKVVINEISDDTGVIVLNWDETIWEMTPIFKNLIQIHGRISYPGTIILPMEIGVEKIYFDKEAGLYQMEREDIDSLNTAHGIAYDWMCSAEQIVSWGVGYNIYDAEFHSLLESAFYTRSTSRNKPNVLNINIDPNNDFSISRLMNVPMTNIENYFTMKRLRHPWLRRFLRSPKISIA